MTTTSTSARTSAKNGAAIISMADQIARHKATKAPKTAAPAKPPRKPTAAMIAAKVIAHAAATAKPEVPAGMAANVVQITGPGRILDDLTTPAFLDRTNPENEARAVTAREKRAEELRRATADAAAAAAAKPAKAPEAPKAKPAAKSKAPKAAPVAKGKGTNGAGTADAPKAPVLSAAGLGALKPRKGETLRADGLPVNGIDDWMIDQVLNKAGALHSEMCAHLGTVDGSKKPWKRCSRRLARAAAVAKVKLTSKPEGDDTRFFGTK